VAAPPACLATWEKNPYRPVCLWDIVIAVDSDGVFWSGLALETLKNDCMMNTGLKRAPLPPVYHTGPIDAGLQGKAITWLGEIEKRFTKCLGMPVSSETAREMIEALQGSRRISYQWLYDNLVGLQKLIRKETRSKVFFYVTPEKFQYFPQKDARNLFGDAVADAFPSAKVDISEAGICLALARPTASVFHLMRAMEIGLAAFAARFGVPSDHTNWHNIIEGIEKAVRAMGNDPATRPLDWKEQREFFSQIASHFMVIKDAWRNYTAHARDVYTEEKATLIFENTGEFMRMLATRLHE
jgi:hypothetical protein